MKILPAPSPPPPILHQNPQLHLLTNFNLDFSHSPYFPYIILPIFFSPRFSQKHHVLFQLLPFTLPTHIYQIPHSLTLVLSTLAPTTLATLSLDPPPPPR